MRLRVHDGVFEQTGWMCGEALSLSVVVGLLTVRLVSHARPVAGLCRASDGQLVSITGNGVYCVSSQRESLTVWSPRRVGQHESIDDISQP